MNCPTFKFLCLKDVCIQLNKLYFSTVNDDMGLDIGALMALSNAPFSQGPPEAGTGSPKIIELNESAFLAPVFYSKQTSP